MTAATDTAFARELQAVREVREETGLDVSIERLSGSLLRARSSTGQRRGDAAVEGRHGDVE